MHYLKGLFGFLLIGVGLGIIANISEWWFVFMGIIAIVIGLDLFIDTKITEVKDDILKELGRK